MGRYNFVLQRPLQLIPVLFGISVVTFLLVQAIPGDPILTMLGQRATPEVIASLRAHYGLDQPIWVQYGYYLSNLFSGDLGDSLVYKISVSELVLGRIEATLALLLLSILFSVLLAVPLAILAATWQGTILDHIIRTLSTIGLGFPALWLGIMLIIVLSVQLGLFPVAGYGSGFWDHLHHLFLPSITIALALSAVLIRNLRASLLEQMNADFVVAAHAKGLPKRWIFYRHVMRNSLIPTINLLGVNIGWLIGGTVVIESVFSIPGLGQLMVQSIFARDYFVVQALTLTFACATVLVSFIVDLITVALDPRIKT